MTNYYITRLMGEPLTIFKCAEFVVSIARTACIIMQIMKFSKMGEAALKHPDACAAIFCEPSHPALKAMAMNSGETGQRSFVPLIFVRWSRSAFYP